MTKVPLLDPFPFRPTKRSPTSLGSETCVPTALRVPPASLTPGAKGKGADGRVFRKQAFPEFYRS